MRSSRVKLLLGALFAVILLFSSVNAHGDHGHPPVVDDLEEDEFSGPPKPEPTPVKSIELPTFTVTPSFLDGHLL
jgi:hypothetical protein